MLTCPRSAASTAFSTIDFACGDNAALSTSKNTTIVAGTSGCGTFRAPAAVVNAHARTAAPANCNNLDSNFVAMAPPLARHLKKTAEDGFLSLNVISPPQVAAFSQMN